MMYKVNLIFLLLLITNLSFLNHASPTHQPAKMDQKASSSSNQNTNTFKPMVMGNQQGHQRDSQYGQHGSKQENNEGKSQGNEGFSKGRVFEYSYSTFHQDPQTADLMSPMSDERRETVLTNGSDNFADHAMARQTLPRFFSYPAAGSHSDNSTDPSASIKQFEEAFKAQAAATGTSETPIVVSFQPALDEVTAASYFNYAPLSVPSFMQTGFSENGVDDDMEEDGIENSDLEYKQSSPVKLERSSDYGKSTNDSEDPKVKMVQVLMGRKNEKGKPWGTKTTLVYRDPKDANNYMQVTEVKMSVKSKKDRPESSGDEISKLSRSSFHGSTYASQPTLGFGGDFFEPSDPQEPSF